MPAAVAARLGAEAEEALHAAFAGTLLPGYQRASTQMFEQLHAAFTSGTERVTSALSAEAPPRRVPAPRPGRSPLL